MEKESKFKVGDKVRIINNLSFHDFVIGQEVTIVHVFGDPTDKKGGHYKVQGRLTYWYVSGREIELVVEN